MGSILKQISELRLGDVMDRHVVAVESDDSAALMIERMKAAHVAHVVVMADGRPVGMFTERDLTRLIHQRVDRNQSVGELMSVPVVVVSAELGFRSAYIQLCLSRLRHLVVVNATGKVVGVAAERDFLGHLGMELYQRVRSLKGQIDTGVPQLAPSCPIVDVIDTMIHERRGCVLVVKDDQFCGIFTEHQVPTILARHLDERGVTLGEVMRSDVLPISEEASVADVVTQLVSERVGYAVVVRESGEVVGAIAQSRLLESVRSAIQAEVATRQLVQDQLLQVEAQLEATLERTPNVAVQWYDSEGVIHYWNHASELLYGWTAIEAMGKSLAELGLLAAEELVGFIQTLRTVGESGATIGPEEYQTKDRNGQSRWVEATIFPIPGETEGEQFIVCMDVDISARKKTELARMESEFRQRTLMEHLPLAIQVFAPDGRTLRVNRAWERLWGVSLPALDGYNVLHDGQLEQAGVLDFLKRAFAGESIELPLHCYYRTGRTALVAPSGEEDKVWLRVLAYPVKDAGGKVLEVVLVQEDVTAHKVAEDALRLSQERLSFALQGADDGLWDWNLETDEVYYSPRWLGMLGYQPDELPQTLETWTALVHADDRESALAHVQDYLEGRSSAYEVEFRMHHKDGRWLNILSRAQLARDESGKPLSPQRLAGTHVDITERKLTESSLRVSEQRLQLALNSAHMGVWEFDFTNGKLYWSPEIFSNLGVPQVEPTREMLLQWIHPDDVDISQHAMDRALAEHAPYFAEYRVQIGDRLIWVEDRGEVQWDAVGRPIKVVGTAHDITQRKQDAQRMQESEANFRTLFDTLKDFLFVIGMDGRLLRVNHLACQKLGYSETELMQMAALELRPEAMREEVSRTISAMLAGEMELCLLPLQTKDGVLIEVETRITAGIWNGAPALYAISRDISERKRSEAALRASEERYRGIFDESVAAIYLFDGDKRFVDSNQAGLELLGYSREELLKLSIPDVDADPVVVQPAHQQLLSGGRIVNFRHKLRRKDGRVVSVLNNSTFLSDGSGVVAGMLSTLTDITELEQSRLALERESEKNQALLRNASDGIHILNESGYVIEASDSFCQMLGYSREEVIGMHVSQWDALFSGDKLQAVVREQFDCPVRSQFETRHRRHDGSVFDVEVSGQPLELAGRKVLFNSSRDITSRKLAELALLSSEAKAHAMLDAIPDLMFRIDAQGVFQDYRAEQSQLYDQSGLPLIGRNIRDTLPAEFVSVLNREIKATLEKRVLRSFEYHLPIPGYGLRDYEARMVPCGEGEVLAVVRDITDRKHAEKTLRQNESLMRTILDNVEAYIYLKDRDGHYLFANRSVRELWGAELAEIIGFGDEKFFDAGTTAKIRENDRQVLERGETVHAEETNTVPATGKTATYLSIKLPLRHEDGSVYALCGISTDISERKRSEETLQRSHSLMEAAMESTADGILVADGQGKVTHFNKRFLELWRIPQQFADAGDDNQLIQFVLEQLTDPQAFVAKVMELYHTPEASSWDELTFRDGRVFERYSLPQKVGDAVVGRVWSFRDVSERRRIESELRENKERYDFSTMIGKVGTWDWLPKTGKLYWNDETFRLMGLEPGAVIPTYQLYLGFVHPDDRETLNAHVLAALNEHQPYSLDCRIVLGSGEEIVCHVTGKVEFDETEQPIRMLGTIQDITERKRQEQALEQQYLFMQAVLDNAPMGMHLYQLGVDGRLVFTGANPAADRILRVANLPFVGKTIEEAFPALVQTEVPAIYRQIAAEGGEWKNDQIAYEDGGSIHGAFQINAFQTVPGQMAVFFEDVTLARQHELALRQSDEQFRSMFELSPDPVWIIEQDRFVECNLAAVEMLRYPNKEALRNTHPSALSPEIQPDGEPSFNKAERMMALAREHGVHRFEWVHRRKDGSDFYAEITLSAITLRGKDVLYCLWRDITERKQAEDAVRRSEERLRFALSSSHQGWFDAFVQTGQTDVGPEYPRMLGYQPEEFHTSLQNWFNSIHPDDVGRVRAVFQQMLLSDLPAEGEYRRLTRTGEWKWMHTSGAVAERDADGRPVRVTGVHMDIDERKRVEAELEEHRQHLEELVASRTAELVRARELAEAASLAKSTFLANMSHEIRTPLNAISGMAHLIRRGGISPEQVARLDKLESASSHLMGIINDILDLSKIEAGRMMLEETGLNVEAVIGNIVSMVHERAKAKGLSLTKQIDYLPHGLLGDPTRLQQVLLNFAGNAIKFTERGGITLTAKLTEETADSVTLRFEVEDSGIGIPADAVERLFTAFEQADSSTTRKFGGTGLGLAINKRLVEMMGGEVGVVSTEGVGSIFWFTVKLKKDDQDGKHVNEVAAQDAEDMLHKRFAGSHILLTEDEPVNREVVLVLLEDVGLVVDVAENGVQAVEQVRQNRYDLILMDMQMPVMDGLTATRHIRQLPNGGQVPIVALTANAFAEDHAACLEAGMNDFTTKPINPVRLYTVLAAWLGKRD